MAKISADLGFVQFKKDGLRRALEQVQAQTNGILLFGLQWRDLEEHFDSMAKAVGESLEHLWVKERAMEERLTEVVSKEREVENMTKEYEGEVLRREAKLALLERRLEEYARMNSERRRTIWCWCGICPMNVYRS